MIRYIDTRRSINRCVINSSNLCIKLYTTSCLLFNITVANDLSSFTLNLLVTKLKINWSKLIYIFVQGIIVMDLKRLYRDYHMEITSKEISKYIDMQSSNQNASVEETSNSVSDAWPTDFLPKSEYMTEETEKNLEKIENLSSSNLEQLSCKKIVKISTFLDLHLIKQVTAEHLIEYSGTPTCDAISYIMNKNRYLQSLVSRKFDHRKIFKMLKYAAQYKNYNMIHVLVKCLQTKKLRRKRFDKMMLYRNLLEQQEGGIFPFDWMLKDSEDSNLNASSEVASLRFCKIIEKLKEMKTMENELTVSPKNIHIFYNSLWKEAKVIVSATTDTTRVNNYFIIL